MADKFKLLVYTSSDTKSISYHYMFYNKHNELEHFAKGVCTNKDYLVKKYRSTDPDLEIEFTQVDSILEAVK